MFDPAADKMRDAFGLLQLYLLYTDMDVPALKKLMLQPFLILADDVDDIERGRLSLLPHIFFERPRKKPRRGPNCGAKTPMPEPSLIS